MSDGALVAVAIVFCGLVGLAFGFQVGDRADEPADYKACLRAGEVSYFIADDMMAKHVIETTITRAKKAESELALCQQSFMALVLECKK